ncbi:hypothetical protein niasHT_021508 [Heterodera trifolii]|uniref:Secreted protein n=1 Tax=Heterodera trifolii TaxID=157864 RepID=A0ABD2KEL9_9BILA
MTLTNGLNILVFFILVERVHDAEEIRRLGQLPIVATVHGVVRLRIVANQLVLGSKLPLKRVFQLSYLWARKYGLLMIWSRKQGSPGRQLWIGLTSIAMFVRNFLCAIPLQLGATVQLKRLLVQWNKIVGRYVEIYETLVVRRKYGVGRGPGP